jgi:hypothetical protein
MMYTYAPPSPEPTPSDGVTPSVSVSPSPSPTGKLPVTGPGGETWGVLGVGVVLVVLGAALVTWVRARHARG